MARRSKYLHGTFKPKNTKKYAGTTRPIYRSSWELQMFITLDESEKVISWASEPVKIPYRNPVTTKVSQYIPDLIIQYVDSHNTIHTELVEIKPMKEAIFEKAKSRKDKLSLIVNQSKWAAAQAFCKQQGMTFRVLTERDLFFRKK